MAVAGVLMGLSLLLLLRGRRQGSDAGRERLMRFESGDVDDGRETRDSVRHPSRALWRLVELTFICLPSKMKNVVASGLGPVAHSGHTIEQLAGIRICATVAMPLFVALAMKFSRASFVLAAPAAAAGYFLPLFMSWKGRARYLDGVRRALPDTTDMLYALVLGGKNLDQAFSGAAAESVEPLRGMMMKTAAEVRLGASRSDAFDRLREKCDLPELSSLLKTLLQAESRGHPPAEALAVFSRELRLRQRDRLRVVVARAPLKMLAPLVFLILPASVLLTVGPTFLATLKNVM